MAKRIGFTIFQLLVTAAGIYYVFHEPEKRAQVGQALRAADWRWLAASWLVYGGVEMVATVRWQLLLRVQGIVIGWSGAGVLVMVGLFFNMFLPGLVGGDAVRLYLLFQKVPTRKTRATLSVVMDRVLGLASLVLLASLVVVLRFGWLNHAPRTEHITYLALAVLGGTTVFALLLLGLMAWRRKGSLPRRVPFRRAIGKIGTALRVYREHPGTVAGAFLLTLVAHLAYYASYYCALRGLLPAAGGGVKLVDFFSIMPLVNTITGVPISFGGVGVRETLFQTLLGQLAHVSEARAALSASLGYTVQASWGIIGGLAYLFVRPAKRRATSG